MKVVLGTAQFGLNYGINNTNGKPDYITVKETLDLASKHGVHILDTAHAYGDAQSRIGEYHSSHESYFLVNSKFTLNSTSIEEQLNHTLNHLNVQSLNVYFYHSFDDFLRPDNRLPELIQLRASGKISKIGVSLYDNNQLDIAICHPEIDTIQLPFNLLDNINQRGFLLKKAKQFGKTIQVRSVFLQGLFFQTKQDLHNRFAPLKPFLEKLHEITVNYNISMEVLAMGYVLAQRDIDEVIIGVDTKEQLLTNLSIQPVSRQLSKLIDDIKVMNTQLLNPSNWR